MNTLPLTSSQTVGPFFSPCMLREDACRNVLVDHTTAGERIRIEGRVIDGDGEPVPDALVETWQANDRGRYNHPADTRDLPLDPTFSGFGRAGTDEDGRFWFESVKPGRVPLSTHDDALQAPHIVVTVFARGLLNHVVTRLYFADDPSNESDPILRHVPAERRSTLLARRSDSAGNALYHFDVVLQGADETVFFNV